MQNESIISVFYTSKTLGGRRLGREGLQPVCHSCETALGTKSKDQRLVDFIPAEAMLLIFSAELAAELLGIALNIVDINQMSFIQRLKFKLQGIPIPCVKIGQEYINGVPTKDEIVEYYFKINTNT